MIKQNYVFAKLINRLLKMIKQNYVFANLYKYAKLLRTCKSVQTLKKNNNIFPHMLRLHIQNLKLLSPVSPPADA